MMTYDDFKEAVKELFKDYLSEEYRHMEMLVESTEKINCTMDGISLVDNTKKEKVFPVIYINDMYDHYRECGDLRAVLHAFAAEMGQGISKARKSPPVDLATAFADVREKIVFCLINTEQNREMLKGIPHREFLDLSVIYIVCVKVDEKCVASTIVKNDMAEELGLDEEQLFKLATDNTRRILPPVVKPIEDIIGDVDCVFEGLKMWVITNERATNGAASILYEDRLHMLAEKLGENMYIMLSSIHEGIAIPVSYGTPDELAQMVYIINMNEVAQQERLSNQVYHYDRELGKLTLATELCNTKLA